MLPKTFLLKRSAALVLLVFGVLLGPAWAQKESVLYSFCAHYKGDVCTDGAFPWAALVFDQKGNLYGTTSGGGASDTCQFPVPGCGVVFKLSPKGKETVLYSFCAQSAAGYDCTDGARPSAGVVFDRKGNLYGTTSIGGAYGYGVVFKLTPEGKETVLHSFCAKVKHGFCTDGEYPAGLVLDQKGNLYGTTLWGGDYGEGAVFKLTPEGKETVLYSFCCSYGFDTNAGLVFDQKGNLYGTTYRGGGFGGGVVFRVCPKGKETVLYSFCDHARRGCPDGDTPEAGPILDQKGNLYGTTIAGGPNGYGVVFKLAPEGKETVLYSFCAESDCADGKMPQAGVISDRKGNLYGTTPWGGDYGEGVVFRVCPKGKETVLHSFCAQNNCTDGSNPYAGLVLDQKGNLYGTTSSGGAHWGGVVFKLTP